MAGTLKTATVFTQESLLVDRNRVGFFPFLKYLFGYNVVVIIIIEKEGKKGHHHAVPDPATVKKSRPFSRTQPTGSTLPPRIPLDRVHRTQSSPEVSQASENWVNCGLPCFSYEDIVIAMVSEQVPITPPSSLPLFSRCLLVLAIIPSPTAHTHTVPHHTKHWEGQQGFLQPGPHREASSLALPGNTRHLLSPFGLLTLSPLPGHLTKGGLWPLAPFSSLSFLLKTKTKFLSFLSPAV